MLLSSPAGNDLLFDELVRAGSQLQQQGLECLPPVEELGGAGPRPAGGERRGRAWMRSRLNAAVADLTDQYGQYRIERRAH